MCMFLMHCELGLQVSTACWRRRLQTQHPILETQHLNPNPQPPTPNPCHDADEYNLLATESTDVCASAGDVRRDSGADDGWGEGDDWGDDFSEQHSYATLTALDKNGIRVLFDFEKSDPGALCLRACISVILCVRAVACGLSPHLVVRSDPTCRLW